MKYLRKLNFLALVVPVYFATRLVNFLIIPIFTDEAIYSYWAQVALHDPANRFISLEDGKQPLFIWLAAIFQRLISDPLVATRLVSVFAGLGSLLGVYFLARELFGTKVAKIAGVLYIILPFTLLYDRMALFDSLLTMFCVWSVFLTYKMAKSPRLDYALLNGIILGLGLITKSSISFFLYLLPASLIVFDFKKELLIKRLSKWLGLSVITFAISETIYNALRVSPLFYMIDRKNHEFIRTFSEVIKNPFLHFSGNINSMATWLFQYNGPLILVVPAVMIYGLAKKDKRIILLSVYILVPFLAKALFNQILYPRFSLFYFPFIIILISFGISLTLASLSKYKGLVWTVLSALIIFPLVSSFYLLTNPPKAGIAGSDKFQYINGWSSGYGIRQIVNILKTGNSKEKVYVGTEGTFGLLPFALQIYFYGNPNIQVVGYWPVGSLPKQVLDSAKTQKTYFIFYQNQNLPQMDDLAHLKLIGKYQKGNGANFMSFYEVNGN
ncbi:MAG: glycosyltransferase family 39 protein [Candidatus Curtissbacteria bacterium]|nr:glycosyltransferase family 39 protein [Candidatus Curtissbacteria bacterium]